MKIELTKEQIELILDGLNALSEGAESEKRATNDPEILEADDAVIRSTEVLYMNLTSQVKLACKDCIENAIYKNFAEFSLDSTKAVKDVLALFSKSQVATILADTIAAAPWDARYSRPNREWSASIAVEKTSFRVLVRSHPGLVDLFVSAFLRIDKEVA